MFSLFEKNQDPSLWNNQVACILKQNHNVKECGFEKEEGNVETLEKRYLSSAKVDKGEKGTQNKYGLIGLSTSGRRKRS